MLGVATRGHSGWVAILGGGARGGGLELEFQLEFDSVEVFEFGLSGLGGGCLLCCLYGQAEPGRVLPGLRSASAGAYKRSLGARLDDGKIPGF